jgi:hypothetical protein
MEGNHPVGSTDPSGLLDWESFKTRAFGGLQAVAGLAEAGFGGTVFVASPDPTFITKAGGAFLVFNGLDNYLTGVNTLFYGKQLRTFTSKSVDTTLQIAGNSPELSRAIGDTVDVVGTTVGSLGYSISRNASLCIPAVAPRGNASGIGMAARKAPSTKTLSVGKGDLANSARVTINGEKAVIDIGYIEKANAGELAKLIEQHLAQNPQITKIVVNSGAIVERSGKLFDLLTKAAASGERIPILEASVRVSTPKGIVPPEFELTFDKLPPASVLQMLLGKK